MTGGRHVLRNEPLFAEDRIKCSDLRVPDLVGRRNSASRSDWRAVKVGVGAGRLRSDANRNRITSHRVRLVDTLPRLSTSRVLRATHPVVAQNAYLRSFMLLP